VVQVLFRGPGDQETSRSRSKTVAKEAEKQRRELEEGFHNLGNAREQRIRPLKEIIDEYLVGYRLRNRAPRFAKYALGHVSRLLGNKLTVDVDASAVLKYQEDRLREGAAPKSINEEVWFLLKMLGDPGKIVRAQLCKEKQLKLKVRTRIGKAFDASETNKLCTEVAKSRRSSWRQILKYDFFTVRIVRLRPAHMIVVPGSIALGFISDDKPTCGE
jgi:hypothetical protein